MSVLNDRDLDYSFFTINKDTFGISLNLTSRELLLTIRVISVNILKYLFDMLKLEISVFRKDKHEKNYKNTKIAGLLCIFKRKLYHE